MKACQKVLVLIPARSGSTRVANKNIVLLGEKHLVGYQIETALESGIGRVIVSTDSEEIAHIAKQYGAEVPFYRPKSIAQDDSSSLSVIEHALEWLTNHESWTPDVLAFCPPTNPFLQSKSLASMLKMLNDRPDINSIVTVAKAATHPFRILEATNSNQFQLANIKIGGRSILDIERSQDWPEVWEGSPACRMTRCSYFYQKIDRSPKTYDPENFLGYRIGRFEATDIDEKYDLLLAAAALKVDRDLNIDGKE